MSASGSGGDAPLLSLANEAQYLLVTRASAEQLLSEISKKHSKQVCSPLNILPTALVATICTLCDDDLATNEDAYMYHSDTIDPPYVNRTITTSKKWEATLIMHALIL